MRKDKVVKTILLLSFAIFGFETTNAQRLSEAFTAPYSLLHQYQCENHLGVSHRLENQFKSIPIEEDHILQTTTEFLKIRGAYLSGDKDIKSKIELYQRDNFDPLYAPKVKLIMGNIYITEGEFNKAEEIYSSIDAKKLSEDEKSSLAINKSIIYLNKKEYSKAEEELIEISASKSSYTIPATFYLGCAYYGQGEFTKAEEAFIKTQENEVFANSSKFYLTNIQFAQKRYSTALKSGEELLALKESAYSTPVKKICGESAFATGNIQKAIDYLSDYTISAPTDKNSAYILGVAYYMNKSYNNAIKSFMPLTDIDNQYSQSAYLYLGHSYLASGDKNGAMFAYKNAMERNEDMQAKECAMYNYCQLIEEYNILPFAEKLNTYENYINLFPGSKNSSTINKLLAASYITAKDYSEVIKSINKIDNPGKDILKAKQVVLYNLGTQEYAKERYSNAKKYFTDAINLGDYDNLVKAKALLWRGEVNYIFKEYDVAEKDFKQHIAIAKSPDINSYYSLGYAQFMTKQYNNAIKQFDNYIAKSNNASTKSDALSRKGDCLYMTRQYSKALKAYGQAEETYKPTSDYPIYMQGIISGVEKENDTKVKMMDKLLSLYPTSQYAPKAMEQKALAQLALNQNDKAVESFSQLYKKYPKTNEARSALLQAAIIYMNEGENDKALSAYKTIVEEYPGSSEATTALEDLKNYHVQQGDIKPYAEYIKEIKGESAYNAADMDSITYLAAENSFLRSPEEKSLNQLKNYLNEYPDGVFRANASHYIGLYHFNNNNIGEARRYFEEVLMSKNVNLREEVLMNLAIIEELDKNYEKSYLYYKDLATDYPTLQSGKEAKSSMVRVLYLDNKHNEAATLATQIISENNNTPNKDEVIYLRAKSYRAMGNPDKALQDWEELSVKTDSEYSAEAKYMVAEINFEKGAIAQAEETINSMLSSNINSRYWIARGIILLSDISAKQGDVFKAKQYLNSLNSNYNEDDNIKSIIKSRLTKYEN